MKTKPELKFRIKNVSDTAYQSFKILITHDMETGSRREPKTGKLIPENFLTHFEVRIGGLTRIEFGISKQISRNPYFAFNLSNEVKSGQIIHIILTDNNGDTAEYEVPALYDSKGRIMYTYEPIRPDVRGFSYKLQTGRKAPGVERRPTQKVKRRPTQKVKKGRLTKPKQCRNR